MAKSVHDTVLDGALNIIKNGCDQMTACDTFPTNETEATTTYKLADVVMAAGDFTVGDGDTNGRKVAVAAKSNVDVDTTGDAINVALIDVGTNLLYVTECTLQTLTSGNTVDFPTWDIEIADPTP